MLTHTYSQHDGIQQPFYLSNVIYFHVYLGGRDIICWQLIGSWEENCLYIVDIPETPSVEPQQHIPMLLTLENKQGQF